MSFAIRRNKNNNDVITINRKSIRFDGLLKLFNVIFNQRIFGFKCLWTMIFIVIILFLILMQSHWFALQLSHQKSNKGLISDFNELIIKESNIDRSRLEVNLFFETSVWNQSINQKIEENYPWLNSFKRIKIIASSLFFVLLIAINFLNKLTEKSITLLSNWIVLYNSIICTKVENYQVWALL